jgi:hypothetical protein
MHPEPERLSGRAPTPQAATRAAQASRGVFGKVAGWFASPRETLTDSVAWELYEAKVREAQHHPTTSELDRLFLSPDSLSAETHKLLREHVDGCSRCQDTETYYRKHHGLFLRRKDDPCD